MNDRHDRGMADVLTWLYNDGSSSAMGRPEPAAGTLDAMSMGSLQASGAGAEGSLSSLGFVTHLRALLCQPFKL